MTETPSGEHARSPRSAEPVDAVDAPDRPGLASSGRFEDARSNALAATTATSMTAGRPTPARANRLTRFRFGTAGGASSSGGPPLRSTASSSFARSLRPIAHGVNQVRQAGLCLQPYPDLARFLASTEPALIMSGYFKIVGEIAPAVTQVLHEIQPELAPGGWATPVRVHRNSPAVTQELHRNVID